MMKAVKGELQEGGDASGQPPLVDAPRPADSAGLSGGPSCAGASQGAEVQQRQRQAAADAEMAPAEEEGAPGEAAA